MRKRGPRQPLGNKKGGFLALLWISRLDLETVGTMGAWYLKFHHHVVIQNFEIRFIVSRVEEKIK